jgi:hypothetical protein
MALAVDAAKAGRLGAAGAADDGKRRRACLRLPLSTDLDDLGTLAGELLDGSALSSAPSTV